MQNSCELSVTIFEPLTFLILLLDYHDGWCALGGGENINIWGVKDGICIFIFNEYILTYLSVV